MTMNCVTRFAPSPTGRLHLGHAYAARAAFQAARENGGKFLLRIEDIDAGRCRPEFIDGIYEDLEWLGLSWDGQPRLQSEHMDEYAEALEILKKQDVLYPCICTRKDIQNEISRIGHAPHAGETVIYPGTCRGRNIDPETTADFAWRLNVEKAMSLVGGELYFHDRTRGEVRANPGIFGDVVLARKEVRASYHLCSVWDDWKQGVTLVTRGEDLFDSTHIHRLLQALFGASPPIYGHHPLILDEKGRRLAKRDSSVTIKALREKGLNAKEIWARLEQN